MDKLDTESIPIHQRRPVQQEELLVVTSLSAISNRIRRNINKRCMVTCVLDLLPILTWMRSYHFRTDLPRDILSGVTITFLQIPQSMAYAYLANVPANVGIYTAIFPTFVYFIFGSSSYVNIGNFSITSLILGKCIAQYANVDDDGTMLDALNEIPSEEQITRLEVLSAITFTVMIFHLVMYVTQVGRLCSLLSPTLVNAFTTGCTIHLIIAQMADLIGANHHKVSGYFRNGYILYDLVLTIPKANYITAIMGLTVVIYLIAYNMLLRSKWRKRSKIPLPMELTVLCIIICISYFMDLSGKYNIKIIGHIPTGFPEMRLPAFSLLEWMVLDAFQIAFVSYIITMSMEMTIAKLVSCEVRTNHELLAMGLCNLVGSFLCCMPVAASMSRSMVQYDAGAVSQIASLVSSILMLIVVMWIAPIFQYLPMCILAAVIIVAVKPLLLQALKFPIIWKMSKMNGIIWLITFWTVVIVDIGIGLLTGIATSIVVICIQSFRPNSCILGAVPDTEIYLNLAIFKEAKEIEGIKIFHYRGGINFATASMYKSDMVRKVGIDAKRIIDKRPRLLESPSSLQVNTPTKCIILDLAASNYIDPDGVAKLYEIQSEFAVFNIPVLLSNVSAKLYEVIKVCEKYNEELQFLMIFPSVHDAVLYAKANILP